MIECPSCGLPLPRGVTYCSSCGETFTSGLTSTIPAETKRTNTLDAPPGRDESIPPTLHFPPVNGEPVIQKCLRCATVLNPAAKFCSVCGRATEPTVFERTIDATRTVRGRAAQALHQAVSQVREQPRQQQVGLAANICFIAAVLCFLYSFYLYPPAVARWDEQTLAHALSSLWWFIFGAFLMGAAAFLKR